MAALTTRWLLALSSLLALLPGPGAAAASPDRVAVTGLAFSGDVKPWMQQSLRKRLIDGLAASGLEALADDKVQQALATLPGPCASVQCRWQLARRLGCRYLVGGVIVGEDRTYAIELWMADGKSGRVIGRVRKTCELCGHKTVADRLDLAASELRAQVQTASQARARLRVTTDPPAAQLFVNEDAIGQSPRVISLRPGEHRITARADGYMESVRQVKLSPGADESLRLKLVPTPTVTWHKPTGYAAAGVGLAAVAAGVTLLALDGSGVGCTGQQEVPGGQCPERLETRAGGASLLVAGVAASVVGGYLLYRAYHRPAKRRGGGKKKVGVVWEF
jgi:hypothetical protein